jgi:signal peptidase I
MPGTTLAWAEFLSRLASGPMGNSSFEYSLTEESLTVPKGMVFVLGDNPGSSFDSRYSGPVPLHALKAKAVIVLWPLGHLKRILD